MSQVLEGLSEKHTRFVGSSLRPVKLKAFTGETGGLLNVPKVQLEENPPFNASVELNTLAQNSSVEYRNLSHDSVKRTRVQFKPPLAFSSEQVVSAGEIPFYNPEVGQGDLRNRMAEHSTAILPSTSYEQRIRVLAERDDTALLPLVDQTMFHKQHPETTEEMSVVSSYSSERQYSAPVKEYSRKILTNRRSRQWTTILQEAAINMPQGEYEQVAYLTNLVASRDLTSLHAMVPAKSPLLPQVRIQRMTAVANTDANKRAALLHDLLIFFKGDTQIIYQEVTATTQPDIHEQWGVVKYTDIQGQSFLVDPSNVPASLLNDSVYSITDAIQDNTILPLAA